MKTIKLIISTVAVAATISSCSIFKKGCNCPHVSSVAPKTEAIRHAS